MRTDLDAAPVGAVADSGMPTHGDRGLAYVRAVGSRPQSPYFNSGVMVMDLVEWEVTRVGDRVLEIVDRRLLPVDFIDQDALNAVFVDQWHALDSTWNTMAGRTSIDPAIVQFPSGVKPWDASASGRFVEEYRRLAVSLP